MYPEVSWNPRYKSPNVQGLNESMNFDPIIFLFPFMDTKESLMASSSLHFFISSF